MDTQDGSDVQITFDRMPGESARAFAAFECYRDMLPVERSIDRAYRVYMEAQGRTVSAGYRAKHWSLWSSRWFWVARVALWDNYSAQRRKEKRLRDLDKARDDIASLSRGALQRIARRLNDLEDVSQIPVNQIPTWLRYASDALLKALGAEERIEISGPAGGPVEFEHDQEVAKLLADPKVRIMLDAVAEAVEQGSDGDADD